MARIKVYDPDKGEWVYADRAFPSGGGIAVTGATVGQTVKIAEVDENGVPTAWESVDFPSGDYEYIKTVTIEEAEVVSCEIDLGAEYKSILMSTWTKTGKSAQVMVTADSQLYCEAVHGDTRLMEAKIVIGFHANRRYVITIDDMGPIIEMSARQTLSSGGENTNTMQVLRMPKIDYTVKCPNKVSLHVGKSDVYFTQGLELDVFGVRA